MKGQAHRSQLIDAYVSSLIYLRIQTAQGGKEVNG
jgi:hypothetical protein